MTKIPTQVSKTINEDGSAEYQVSATKPPNHLRKLKTQGNGATREKVRDAYHNLTADGWAPRGSTENINLAAQSAEKQRQAWFAMSNENAINSQGSSPIKTSPSKSYSPAKVATGAPYQSSVDPNKFANKRGASDAA